MAEKTDSQDVSRRRFLRTAAGATSAMALGAGATAKLYAAGSPAVPPRARTGTSSGVGTATHTSARMRNPGDKQVTA